MRLEKAIEILQFRFSKRTDDLGSGTKEAIQLGIEALKRLQHTRKYTSLRDVSLLPGETKE